MDELTGGDGNEGSVGGEPGGGDTVLEGDAVEEGAAAEVDELAAIAVVDGEEERAVGGDGDAADVGGGLDGEGCGLRFAEVCDGNSVTDG